MKAGSAWLGTSSDVRTDTTLCCN